MKKVSLPIFFLLFTGSLLFSAVPDTLVRFETIEDVSGDIEGEKVLKLFFTIEDGWHINSQSPLDEYSVPARIVLNENPYYSLKSVHYPEPRIVSLESLGGRSSVFDRMIDIQLTLQEKKSPSEVIRLEGFLSYQGCDNSVCLIPMETEFSLFITPVSAAIFTEQTPVQSAPVEKIIPDDRSMIESQMATSPVSEGSFEMLTEESPFSSGNFFWILILVFAGGLALNLTPCVYPLIPITISYFGSQKSRGNVFLMAVLYVAGMAVTYSILGTAAALSGNLFGSLMTNPTVLILLALLMLALSLSMFGLYEFRLPYALTQLGGSSRSGYIGSLIMGLTMGIVAAPCIGPFVISLLTYVAASGSPVTGFLLFFVMSLGLGIPYIFLAMFSAKLDTLPRSGEWLNGVRIFFGLVLIGMALWFIHPLLNPPLSRILLPLYFILAGIYYSVFNRAGETSPGFRKVKLILSLIAVIAGTWLIKPDSGVQTMLNWQTYNTRVLLKADEEGRYVMIDFYSDSCVPCKELDAITFRHPEVVDILENFTLIKVDLTRGGSELIKEYNIKGFPTVIFLDPDGRELRSFRLLGYENPEAFVKRLKMIDNQ